MVAEVAGMSQRRLEEVLDDVLLVTCTRFQLHDVVVLDVTRRAPLVIRHQMMLHAH